MIDSTTPESIGVFVPSMRYGMPKILGMTLIAEDIYPKCR